jgi:hypothetical protein
MARAANRAKVVLDLTGSSPAIEDSENVEAITDVDSEYLVVHFGTPFKDELYRCDIIPSEPVDFGIRTRRKDGVGIRLAMPRPKRVKIVCEAV